MLFKMFSLSVCPEQIKPGCAEGECSRDAENLPMGPEGQGQGSEGALSPAWVCAAPHTTIPILCLSRDLPVSLELLEHIPTVGQGVLYGVVWKSWTGSNKNLAVVYQSGVTQAVLLELHHFPPSFSSVVFSQSVVSTPSQM